MKVYSFDVDETLEVSNGPIKLQTLMDLRIQGHIVGLNGNWSVVTAIPGWQHLISFFNIGLPKPLYMTEFQKYIKADEYIHVGNIRGTVNSLGVICGSDDNIFAAQAGWRFIKEDDFAKGIR